MKKKKAAKKLSPKQERAMQRVRLRGLACRAAAEIQCAFNSIDRSRASEDSNEQLNAMEEAESALLSMAGLIVTFRHDPAKFLHMVAYALKGKLRGARFDDAIDEAVERAIRDGNRKAERSFWLAPFLGEVYDAFDK